MKQLTILWVGLMSGLLIPSTINAQGYGQSVAVGEAEIFVGESLNESSPGYVFIYRKDANNVWSEAQRLEASNSTVGDHFGRALAYTGEHLLVGATTLETIYVFAKDENGLWKEQQAVKVSDTQEGDFVGRVSASDQNHVLMSSLANSEARGAVYVFERDEETNLWSESAKLMGSDTEPNDLFGFSLAIENGVALIGAPRQNNITGSVYTFTLDQNTGDWIEGTKLSGAGTSPNSGFGVAVALHDGRAIVGAATHEQGMGIAYTYDYEEESKEWNASSTLKAFDEGNPGTQFGAAIQINDGEVWLGAPGASDFQGRIYSISQNPVSGDWVEARKLSSSELISGDQFGSALAVKGNLGAVGIIGADYQLGTVAIYERTGNNWDEVTRVFNESESLVSITGGEVRCEGGSASEYTCNEVDMVSFLSVEDLGGTRGVQLNDVWGWTDPSSGREYALVGRYDGTSFVDVTDSSNPRYLGNLPMTTGARGNSWRDIKVYKNHAFIVADGSGPHGMQIFDLTRLREVGNEPLTFEVDAHYSSIASAHNVVINEESGFAYVVGVNGGGETCGGGLHMVNIQDPLTPIFSGCFAHANTGRQNTGYSHDAQCVIYQGPDSDYTGQEICFSANETALSISDVTDKANPLELSMATYPNVAYTHQGWLDEEQQYFYMNDELDELGGNVTQTRTLVWDVTDLEDPVLALEHFADNASSDHNLYIQGDLMYQSNYVSGLRILDISDRENPEEIGFFDTVPWTPDAPGFDGSWSNYPFFSSGIIIVNSGKEGMFILRKSDRNLIP